MAYYLLLSVEGKNVAYLGLKIQFFEHLFSFCHIFEITASLTFSVQSST